MNRTIEERDFLLWRLREGDHRSVGRSSTAMVVAAMLGTEPTDRPHDDGDLGRCLATRRYAPAHLHPAMDRMIAEWTEMLRAER